MSHKWSLYFNHACGEHLMSRLPELSGFKLVSDRQGLFGFQKRDDTVEDERSMSGRLYFVYVEGADWAAGR